MRRKQAERISRQPLASGYLNGYNNAMTTIKRTVYFVAAGSKFVGEKSHLVDFDNAIPYDTEDGADRSLRRMLRDYEKVEQNLKNTLERGYVWDYTYNTDPAGVAHIKRMKDYLQDSNPENIRIVKGEMVVDLE